MIDPVTLDAARRSLAAPRLVIARAKRGVPDASGLYAVHAEASLWRRLGLGDPPDDRPLYVGKAEGSLADRSVGTHFSTGKTGSSTLRRSLAGLLADELDLRGQPRNTANPGAFANFGLEPAGDARLTEWMLKHLMLSVWSSPVGVALAEIETELLDELAPPLNLDDVMTSWRPLVRSARKRLADQARAWPLTPFDEVERSPNGSFARTDLVASVSNRVLGVDAAGKRGWVGIVIDDDGFIGARVGNLRAILDWAEPIEVIGIDIPIGHVPGGSRRADVEARRFVGPRASSVFTAPPEEVLDAGSYVEANEELTSLRVPKLSRQAWALVPKMAEAAEVACTDDRVFEVHPEVSFCELAGAQLRWSKKSWNGLLHRRQLLAAVGIELDHIIAGVEGVAADDVVDAAVVAWSAHRIAGGAALSLPDPPEESDGRQVAIWR